MRFPYARWLVAVVVTTTAAASACTPTHQVAPEVEGKVRPNAPGIVLDVAMFEGMGLTDLIRKWELEHPGVSVRFIDDTWIEQNSNVLADFDGGPTPDIATVEHDYTAAVFLVPENFYDLRAFGADELEDQFLRWRWNHGVAATGEVVGIPTDVGGLAIAYRTDLFERAGLPTDPDAVAALWPTWEEYLRVAQQYSKSDGPAYLASSGWLFRGIANQGGDRFGFTVDSDGTFVPSESLAHAWEIAAAATQFAAGITPFSAEAINSADDTRQFATVIAPAWMTNFMSINAPASERVWGVAPAPGGFGNWGGSQLTIPARAKNPELAWDLIAFLSRPESQLALFEDRGNFPSISALADNKTITDSTSAFFRDAPVGEIFSAAVKGVTRAPVGRWDRVVTTTFERALRRIEREGFTADDAYAEAIDHLTECLNSPDPTIEGCSPRSDS